MLRLALLAALLTAILHGNCIQAEASSSTIELLRIQPYVKQNAKKCHTLEFLKYEHHSGSSNAPPLVVRRGSIISLTAYFSQAFSLQAHRLVLRVKFIASGSTRDIDIAPNAHFAKKISAKAGAFHADMYRIAGHETNMEIFLPANLAIGKWSFSLHLYTAGKQQLISLLTLPNEVFIFFNPWSAADPTYLSNNVERNDYVLSEVGTIYRGTRQAKESIKWHYEQFGPHMLKIINFILSRAGLKEDQLASPIFVSRAFSALVNSNDENGVVEGKWERPFAPHKSPWEWIGSGPILRQYYATKGRPVKYGQCWVFAGVVGTLARAVGLPSRTVTAYYSAHDVDRSMTIDRYLDLRGAPMKEKSGDSIWNFHVWNEVWFRRTDISNTIDPNHKAPGNWQVIDATPQQTSYSGRFELGPAQVSLVRSGDITSKYDIGFLYSEVNADIVYYQMNLFGRFYKSSTSINQVGSQIITYLPDQGLVDITHHYKHQEGTAEERASYRRATNDAYQADDSHTIQAMRDAKFVFDLVSSPVQKLGSNMTVRYRLINAMNENRTVFVNLDVHSIYYTGRQSNKVFSVAEDVPLKPFENLTVEYRVSTDEYFSTLVEFNQFRVTGYVKLEQSNISIAKEEIIELYQPQLNVSLATAPCLQGEENRIQIGFQNPVNKTLTGCKLTLKDNLLFEEDEEVDVPDVQPLQKIRIEWPIIANNTGQDTLSVLINCVELYDIRGSLGFEVGTYEPETATDANELIEYDSI